MKLLHSHFHLLMHILFPPTLDQQECFDIERVQDQPLPWGNEPLTSSGCRGWGCSLPGGQGSLCWAVPGIVAG